MKAKGRIIVDEQEDYLEISIRLLRNLYVIVPLLFGSLLWLFGLVFLVDKVFQSYRTLIEMGIAGMLFFWLFLGGIMSSTLFWIFFGKEKVLVTRDYIQTEKPIHLYKRQRSYPLSDVKNIRIIHELFKVKRDGQWVDDERTILTFETPYKKVTFGRGIKPEEAEFVLMALASSRFLDESHFQPVSLA